MKIKRTKIWEFGFLIIGFSLLFGLAFFLIQSEKSIKVKEEEKEIDEEKIAVLPLESKHQLNKEETKLIELEISEEDYLKIKEKRDSAVKDGVLLTNDADYVKAKIHYGDEKLKAKIRLKGDWTQHLEGDTWSFRVKLSDNYTLNGMRKFSLQHPQTRNFAGEWLFHEMLKAHDILHLRYDFLNVNLIINKTDGTQVKREFGYYAIEEFFDKQLIEHNKRRAGVLLKIDEDPIWKDRRDMLNKGIGLSTVKYLTVSDYPNLTILPFNSNKVLSDPNLKKQFDQGRVFLENFVDQKVKASEVYDVEKLATYNAICNILGANHSMILHNVRAYYNPINSKLEPIGFDANPLTPHYFILHFPNTENDLVYQEYYAAALEKMISEEYFPQILNWPGLKENIENLKAAYPKYKWDENAIHGNRKFIDVSLSPVKSLNIFFLDHDRATIKLNIENYSRFPKEITGIKLTSGRVLGAPARRTIIAPNEKQTITFRVNKDFQRLFVNKKQGKTNFDLARDIPKLKVIYKTWGTSKIREESILSWGPKDEGIQASNIFNRKTDLTKFGFLVVDEKNKIITAKQGDHYIRSELIIPKGYTFRIYEGTSFDFTDKKSFIISFSPVEFLGSKSKPIRFKSERSFGSGMLVLNTDKISKVENCIFENLDAPNAPHWSVSGAINFYKAPVHINNCSFKDMRCEDALNIISTNFEINNSLFSNSYSDAFDGDFVTGTIKNTIFGDLGNDAIDVSGSNIQVENVTIFNASDKGLSAGEDSRIDANKVVIKDSEIGIASKDQSIINIKNCLLENNTLGFTAYQKKSEFGPGNIIADSTDLINTSTAYLIEKGSKLIWNGKKAEVVNRVLDRMYGAEFGKRSE